MMPSITLQDFIDRSNIIHNFKYDYIKVYFNKLTDRVIIICPIHQEFEQVAKNHINGNGCKQCCVDIQKGNKEDFINSANKIHNFKYDYSKIIFQTSKIKVKISCDTHGDFEQRPNDHLNKQGCPKCGIDNKKVLLVDFVARSNKIHNFKYDYSKSILINTHCNITIGCSIHGYFEQKPYSHLAGYGCDKCSKTYKLTANDFIIRANNKHNFKYDYSKISLESATEKITIICPLHNEFTQTPSSHLFGQGCPKCAGFNKTTEDFIDRSNIIHNFKYDYSNVKYQEANAKVSIICLEHGEFEQKSYKHLQGQGCPKCRESKGEKSIRRYLIENNISFDDQYSFYDCRNIKVLPFDFVILDENKNCKALIEYQGRQHYESIDYWNGEEGLKYQQLRDQIKFEYCSENNIPLLRIPYWEYKNISKLLNEFIC